MKKTSRFIAFLALILAATTLYFCLKSGNYFLAVVNIFLMIVNYKSACGD